MLTRCLAAIALAVASISLAGFVNAEPLPAPSWWQKIYAALKWEKAGPSFVTRGSDVKAYRFGDLFEAPLGKEARALTSGQRLRSPIHAGPKNVLALSESGLVTVAVDAQPPTVTALPRPAVSVAWLLQYRNEPPGVAVLDETGCVAIIDLAAKQPPEVIECGLTQAQRETVLARSRYCGGQRLGERITGSPPTRIDVMVYPADKRVGTAMTAGREARMNLDAAFSVDCSGVLFVSSRYVQ